MTPVIEELRVQSRRQVYGLLDDRIARSVLEAASRANLDRFVFDVREGVHGQAIVETFR